MKIAILGAGESGTGAAILARQKGFETFVSELNGILPKYKDTLINYKIDFEEGRHSENRILTADEIIKSPGIPDTPLIQKAKAKAIPVIDELEFAARFTKAKLVAITGTNGKTTTSLLTFHLLCQAGFNVGLAGNVGQSFARQVAENDKDYYVIEVSSFQIDGMRTFKPDIMVLLNITPDHLDRYEGSFQNYAESKFNLARNMTRSESLIYFRDDPIINKMLNNKLTKFQKIPISINKKLNFGSFFYKNDIFFRLKNHAFSLKTTDTSLIGMHNYINIMAAILAGILLDIDKNILKRGLKTFKNVPHRMELVAVIDGVKYINDSKATNVNAVKYALEAIDVPIVWIAGGVDKGNNYDEIKDLVESKVKVLVCLGKDNSRLTKYFKDRVAITETNSMQDALLEAKKQAKPGDVILLSPACASFDLFKNYEDRGDNFRQSVSQLIQ